jgi:hypothetical protein
MELLVEYPPLHATDIDLVSQALTGSRAAFASIVSPHHATPPTFLHQMTAALSEHN